MTGAECRVMIFTKAALAADIVRGGKRAVMRKLFLRPTVTLTPERPSP